MTVNKANLGTAIQAALAGGKAILEVYQRAYDIEYKADDSPLTEADRLADLAITAHLKNSFPILSEEGKAIPYAVRKQWDIFWLVDPLDGTKEFINKNGEFTVNIALIKGGIPVLGVVFLPTQSTLYFASAEIGSYVLDMSKFNGDFNLTAIIEKAVRLNEKALPEKYTIVASRSHLSAETAEFIETCKQQHGTVELISKGSSIKLCLVAERKAHVYPRVAPTMEWDTAAAHAVAKYAGCQVLNYDTRTELTYNKENLLNPSFIVIA